MSKDFQVEKSYQSFDLSRIAVKCGIENLFFDEQTASTNDRARLWQQANPKTIGGGEFALFLARNQFAGRGRGDHQWQAGDGSLTMTLLTGVAIASPHARGGLLCMAVACGVCDALQVGGVGRSDGVQAFIKWPNDIFLNDQKLGGILIETAGPSHFAIGIGLNINNDVSAIPHSTGLKQATGNCFSMTESVVEVFNAVVRRIRQLDTAPEKIVDEFRRRDWLIGKTVRWNQGSQSVNGSAVGIEQDGGLRLEVGNKTRVIYTGSIRTLDEE